MNQYWGIIALISAIYVIYDVFAVQKSMKSTDKLLWTIGAIIFSVITLIVYLVTVKRK